MQFYFKAFFFFLIAVCQWTPFVKSQTLTPTVGPSISTFTPTLKPSTPTIKPTLKPSISQKPTISHKPSRKPSGQPVHIYGNKDPVLLPQQTQQIIVGVLTIVLFILMAVEFLSPEVLFLIAVMILTGCQILTLSQAFAGFSNTALVTIGALFLVIGGVEKSHAVDYLARKAFGTTGSIFFSKARIYVTCFLLSIFFNNTPLVAILLPVLKDWGRMRKVPASQLLMPLSFSVLAGSFGSMIGTSTNLTLQGLMLADRGVGFSFFAPAPIGFPLFFVLLIYELLLGPWLLPHRSGPSEGNEGAEKLIAEVYVSHKSLFVGKSISYMMNSLGLAPSLAIKIRRKNSPSSDVEVGTLSKKFSFRQIKNSMTVTYMKRISGLYSIEKPDLKASTRHLEESTTRSNQEYFDIVAPDFHEILVAEDVVFIANAQATVKFLLKSIAGESKGLTVLQSDALTLPGYGTNMAELVVSDSNPFLGRKVSDLSAEFTEVYNAAILTVKGKDWDAGAKKTASAPTKEEQKVEVNGPIAKTETDDDESKDVADKYLDIKILLPEDATVSDHVLGYGDTILVVTTAKNISNLKATRDFFVVSPVGEVPIPMNLYTFIPVVIFFTMLLLAATDTLDIAAGSMMVAAFFFLGGWIKPEEIPKLIDLRLLMLIGLSLSFATAMTSSGLALKIASGINDAHPTPFAALLLIYAITLLITELVSNNAAAALMYPIAVALADQLLVDFKPFAMAVLVASTAGFMSPIGYQTHVMVWAPGGYKFIDFIKFGFFPDIAYWLLGCALIVAVYPF